MHHLRHKTPNHPNYEPVSRGVALSDGTTEIITMPKSTWDYADWLSAEMGATVASWVEDVKAQEPDYLPSHVLWTWLWRNECERFREGLETPDPYPPMGYQGWGE